MSEQERLPVGSSSPTAELDLCEDCGKTIEKPEPRMIPVLFFNLSAQLIEPSLCDQCRRVRILNHVRVCMRPYKLPIPRPPR